MWIWVKVNMLNLFNSESGDRLKERRERHITRFYVAMLSLAFTVLIFYTVLSEETKTYTVQFPTQMAYEKLQVQYPNTIQCPCKSVSVPYQEFIQVTASYHQVCSSQFVLSSFFGPLALITESPLHPIDFMRMSVPYFQWLATFCGLAVKYIQSQYALFRVKRFVNDKLLAPDSFKTQMNDLVQGFIDETNRQYNQAIKQARQMLAFAQPLTGTKASYSLPMNVSNNQISIVSEGFPGCSCMLKMTSCSTPAAFYAYNQTGASFDLYWSVLGVRIACTAIESLLQSSLECWYMPSCYEKVKIMQREIDT